MRHKKVLNTFLGLLVLLFTLLLAYVPAAGLSIAAKLLAKQFDVVARNLEQSLNKGNNSANILKNEVFLKSVLEGNEVNTTKDVITRFKEILGKDHPHLSEIERLLRLSDEALLNMSDSDQIALNSIYNTLASVYKHTYEIPPLCPEGCISYEQIYIVNNVDEVILRSVQDKYSRIFIDNNNYIRYGPVLRQELTDLSRTSVMKDLIKDGVFNIDEDPRGKLKILDANLQELISDEQAEMLSVLHAMNHAFLSKDKPGHDFFVDLLRFNSGDLLANRFWRIAIFDESEISTWWAETFKAVYKENPSVSAHERIEIWLEKMDEKVARLNNPQHIEIWEEIKRNRLCDFI